MEVRHFAVFYSSEKDFPQILRGLQVSMDLTVEYSLLQIFTANTGILQIYIQCEANFMRILQWGSGFLPWDALWCDIREAGFNFTGYPSKRGEVSGLVPLHPRVERAVQAKPSQAHNGAYAWVRTTFRFHLALLGLRSFFNTP